MSDSRTMSPGGERPSLFSAARIAEISADPGSDPRMPTPEQAEIIEQPVAGSVLVIAGAGSGKTETMANRVVWLVANGLVMPAEVLGLTFTRKAAGELGERIAERLIGFANRLADLASRGALGEEEAGRAAELVEVIDDGLDLPAVSTYNAFAASIVEEFGAVAGVAAAATVIDESVAWRIAREIVCSSDDPELARSEDSIAAWVKRTIELDHAVSDNLTDFEAVDRAIEEFEAAESWSYADNRRKQPYAGVVKAVAAVRSTRAAARLAEDFAAEKRRRGLIEFSDQLALAVQTLQRSEAAIRAVRRRTRVVLLDEVQDTSVGQTRLLSALFSGGSVMAVGDPHQSIYGFRGASANNLTSFHSDFGDRAGRTLNLSISWRNPSEVLEVANLISAPLAEKLRARASDAQRESPLSVPKLVSKEEWLRDASKIPDAGSGGRIEGRFAETTEEEFAAVAEWMAEARSLHVAEHGVLPTAAVVLRKRRRMPDLQAALHAAGVPSKIIGLGGLLSTPEITDVVCTLRCLWYADAGSELIRILTGPRFRVGVKDIEALRRAARWFAAHDAEMQPISASELPPPDAAAGQALADPDRRVTLLDALDEIAGMRRLDRPSLAGISEEGRVRLQEAALMLRRLRRGVGGDLMELLRSVEQELRIDIELDAHEGNGYGGAATARANLDSFADLIGGFLATDDQGTIASVLEWLERATEDDSAAEHTPEPEPGTVQLITGHGAKGLEWDLVAVPRLVDGDFPAQSREGLGWLRPGQLPDVLRRDIAARPRLDWTWLANQRNQKVLVDAMQQYRSELADRHIDEERRLAYVSVTRAASRLLLTGSWWGSGKTPQSPSIFLRELAEAGVIPELPAESAHETNPNAEAGRTLSWPLDPLGERAEPVLRAAAAVRAALETKSGETREARGARIDPVVELLIAELTAERDRPTLPPPDRVTASTFHEFVESPEAAERNRLRPLPIRPYRRTRVGNLFHEWVERRTTTALGTALTLPGIDDDLAATLDEDLGDEGPKSDDQQHLEALIERFEGSRFASLQPIAVELEVHLPFAGRSLACKLDAVYRSEGGDGGTRYEVVDWKTGQAPHTESERQSRFLQLDLYRHAYARWAGVEPERIDVTLFYVAESMELRGDRQRSLEELEELWFGARETVESAAKG